MFSLTVDLSGKNYNDDDNIRGSWLMCLPVLKISDKNGRNWLEYYTEYWLLKSQWTPDLDQSEIPDPNLGSH